MITPTATPTLPPTYDYLVNAAQEALSEYHRAARAAWAAKRLAEDAAAASLASCSAAHAARAARWYAVNASWAALTRELYARAAAVGRVGVGVIMGSPGEASRRNAPAQG